MFKSRTFKAGLALTVSSAVVLGPTAYAAQASVIAPAPAAPASAPTEPSTSPVDVGQSVQLRVNASGEPNGPGGIDFRWSVTQVTIPGPDIPETVTIPEEGDALRSLISFDEPTQDSENGTAEMPVTNHGSWGDVRTVSLVPQDFNVPLKLSTKFTLNGEEIAADDLVGQDGMVTTKYCIKNLSEQTYEVPITTLSGEKITEKVKAQVPMVAQASTLLPQRFVDLNMGAGLGGADGRGNTQAQWIVLPFTPINQDGGKACFGWAANVEDAVLPSMVIQVQPIYIPEQGKSGKDGGSFSLPAIPKPAGGFPDLSQGRADISAGLANVIEAIQIFRQNQSGQDPLQSVGNALTGFFNSIGVKVIDLSNDLNKTIRTTGKNAERMDNLAPPIQKPSEGTHENR